MMKSSELFNYNKIHLKFYVSHKSGAMCGIRGNPL